MNVTADAPVKPVPKAVTGVPTGPLPRVNDVIDDGGVTLVTVKTDSWPTPTPS